MNGIIETLLLLTLAGLSPEGPPHPPPREAIQACEGKEDGDACSFASPHGELSGECMETPRELVCVPDGAPPPPPPPG